MSFCASFYRTHCGFHVLGLPYVNSLLSRQSEAKSITRCPFERGESCFGNKETVTANLKELASMSSLCPTLVSLSLSGNSQTQNPSISPSPLMLPSPSSSPPPPRSFLTLPGELRNSIYRYALVVGRRPFALLMPERLHPESYTDTALLRVNKQVFKETTSVFYHENTFRLTKDLFHGAPILEALEVVHHVSRERLRSMRSLVIDIPV